MAWIYDRLNRLMSHEGFGVSFTVTHAPDGPPTFEISKGTTQDWSEHDWDERRTQMEAAVADEARREKMIRLLRVLKQDYRKASEVIRIATARDKVSVRSIQAWVAEPGRPSHRRCPEWAVAALETYIASQPVRQNHDGPQMDISARIDRDQLKWAEARVYQKKAILEKWRGVSLSALPEKLAEMELALLDFVHADNARIVTIMASLRSEESFADFRKKVRDAEAEKTLTWKAIVDGETLLKNVSDIDGLGGE